MEQSMGASLTTRCVYLAVWIRFSCFWSVLDHEMVGDSW